jgi:amiloride-sensitive sodium channel
MDLWAFVIQIVIFRRQCYFQNERHLKFFRIYTKANCEMECLTNLTLRYCNCSRFYMPSISFYYVNFKFLVNLLSLGSPGTPICKYNQDQKCFDLAKLTLGKMFQTKMVCDPSLIDQELICNCLPLCNEVTYDTEIIQSEEKKLNMPYAKGLVPL